MNIEHVVRKTIREILYDNYDYLRPSGCLQVLARGKKKGFLCGKKIINEEIHYCKKHSGIVKSKEIPDLIRLPNREDDVEDIYIP